MEQRLQLENVQVESHIEHQDLEFCTCFDLNRKGLSTLDISRQLIANDAALYGADILGANAGTTEQWASQIVAAPGNWHFLCDGTDIVGNWSYTYLSAAEEKSVRNGTFAGEDFSLDSVNYPLAAPDREVVIYILNISLNEGYQTAENWNRLFGKKEMTAEEDYRNFERYLESNNLSQAIQSLISAADKGHVEAQALVGKIYSDGEYVPKNDAKAFMYSSRAAAAGNVNAKYERGKAQAYA